MGELGNLNSSMRLQCKICNWRPPDDAIMEAVQLHFQVEHDTDAVTLDLVAVCSCGAAMTFVRTAPTGGGFKDHMECGACGNKGFVKRDAGG